MSFENLELRSDCFLKYGIPLIVEKGDIRAININVK